MNAMQARRNVERQIARNPSSIAIKRSQEVDDGAGGSYRETAELPAQTVRIFMSTFAGTDAKDSTGLGGHIQTQRWGLLALGDADVVKGDVFTHQGRQFRVRSISPASTGGQTAAIHADLEEVS